MLDWTGIGREIKNRRGRLGMTQDFLASKLGVRLATIGRLEIGDRRPSLTMLENLAKTFNCQVKDLLIEKEEKVMTTTLVREPSLRGAPTYFRRGVEDASTRACLGTDVDGHTIWATYDEAAWHLAIHVEDYLTDEAADELAQLGKEPNGAKFDRQLLDFFDREFPGCMELIPRNRRTKFLEGINRAIEEERFPI